MSPLLDTVTKQASKVRLGVGAKLKVWFGDEPVGAIVATLDIPGAFSKYLNFDVSVLFFSVKFALLAIR